MWRYLFNRKFYSYLYRAYVDSAIENCTTMKYKPALRCAVIDIVLYLILSPAIVYVIYEYSTTSMSMDLTMLLSFILVVLAAMFVHTLHDLLERVKKMLIAMDTIETPASSDAYDAESAIAAYQSEQFMNWYYKGPHLERWPHSIIPQPEDSEALRNLRLTKQKLRRNYEKLSAQQSPDSAVSETSFIESERGSYDESNLLLQAEHRSRHPSASLEGHSGLTLRSLHPSGSLEGHSGLTLRSRHPSGSVEEHAGLTHRSRHPSGSLDEHAGLTRSLNPSISSEEQAIPSTFVTVAEVHRSNYEESD